MKALTGLIIDAVIRVVGNVAYVLYSLFGWRFISLVGVMWGSVQYLLNSKKRKSVKSELSKLFGGRFSPEQIDAITKESFYDYYERQIEMFFFGVLDRDRINDIVRAEGWENLDGALSQGKGVILLLSHFGSFLLPLPYLGYRGYRVNQITGLQLHTSLIAERLWHWRKREAEKLPVNFLQVGTFLKPLFKALRNNEIVAIAFDGRDGSRWAAVDFFERKALFSTGPFRIARKTGAVIIPTFIVKEKGRFHRLVLRAPFQLSTDVDSERALRIDTEKFAHIFAEYVVRYPSHFGMILYILQKQAQEGTMKPFFVET